MMSARQTRSEAVEVELAGILRATACSEKAFSATGRPDLEQSGPHSLLRGIKYSLIALQMCFLFGDLIDVRRFWRGFFSLMIPKLRCLLGDEQTDTGREKFTTFAGAICFAEEIIFY